MRLFKATMIAPILLLAAVGCSESPDHASFADEVDQKLAALDEHIKSIGAEFQGDDLKAEYHEMMASLEEQRAALGNKMEHAADVSSEKWAAFKADVDKSYDSLVAKIEELRKRIGEDS